MKGMLSGKMLLAVSLERIGQLVFLCFSVCLWLWGLEGDKRGMGDYRLTRDLCFGAWQKIMLFEGCLVWQGGFM